MPYLQLDVPRTYPAEVKRRLARRMGEIYARVMQTGASRVRVGFRELAEGGLWHCTEGEPRPGVVLSCDIRRGRTAAQRAALAEELIKACRRSEEHTSELQSLAYLVCRLLLEKKKKTNPETMINEK